MADWIYVDNSNVFIEGQRVAAVKNGYALSIYDAMREKITDPTYRLSFGKLRDFVSGQTRQNSGRLVLFGSRPPEHDDVWKSAERAGYEVELRDRNGVDKEKGIDTALAIEMVIDACTKANSQTDTFTLVSGDADFVPVVQKLHSMGYTVDVVFWNHAAQELKNAASSFFSLNDVAHVIAY